MEIQQREENQIGDMLYESDIQALVRSSLLGSWILSEFFFRPELRFFSYFGGPVTTKMLPSLNHQRGRETMTVATGVYGVIKHRQAGVILGVCVATFGMLLSFTALVLLIYITRIDGHIKKPG